MNNGGLYNNVKMSLKTANIMVLAAIAVLIFCFVLAVGTAANTVSDASSEPTTEMQNMSE